MTIRRADRVTIHYPDGTTDTYRDIDIDHVRTEHRGDPKALEGTVRYALARMPESRRDSATDDRQEG